MSAWGWAKVLGGGTDIGAQLIDGAIWLDVFGPGGDPYVEVKLSADEAARIGNELAKMAEALGGGE